MIQKGLVIGIVIAMVFIVMQGVTVSGNNLYFSEAPGRQNYMTWNDGNDEQILDGVWFNNSLFLCGYGKGGNDALIMKYDNQGNLGWYKYLDFGGTNEVLYGIVADDDGNLIATGRTYNGNDNDMVIVKFDQKGSIIWEKTYQTDENDAGFALIYDPSDSTYVVVGEGKFEDAYIWKYSKAGEQIWVKDIAPSNFDFDDAHGIIKYDNYYYVVGYGDNTDTGDKEVYIVQVDTNGNVQSSYVYGVYGDDRGGSIIELNGYLYIATSVNGTYSRIYNISTDGALNWALNISEGSKTILSISTNGQNIMLTGYVEDTSGNNEVHIEEIDGSGNKIWEKNDSVTGNDIIQNGAIWSTSNTFYVVGYTTNSSDSTDDTLWVEYSWPDNIPPQVHIISPVEGAITNSTVNATWSGSDNIGIDHYEISDGGDTWINVGQRTYYSFESLSGGPHTIYVRAYDYAGNSAYAEVNFTVDNAPPAIDITEPRDRSFQNPTVYVKWNASDNEGIDHYEISSDGHTWINVGTATHYTFSGLSQGNHTIYVKAYDIVNNTAEDSVNITVDTYIPKVYIITPADGIWINTTNVNVVWSGSDDNGIDHYEVSKDGSSWNNVGSVNNYEFKDLKEGKNYLYIKAVDIVGNVGIVYDTVYVDTAPPSGSIISPTRHYISERNITLKWSMDDNYGISKCEVSDGQSWIDVGVTTNYTFTNLDEGTYNFSVKIIDKSGNTYISSINVVVDLTPPIIAINDPSANVTINITTMTIKWDINETYGLSALKIMVDNTSWKSLDINAQSYTVNLSDGEHSVQIMAVDLAGNTAIKKVNFTVDSIPPTLYFVVPSNNTWINKSVVNITWFCDDARGINIEELRVDNDSWKELQPIDRSYTLNLPEGKHTIEIMAADKANNEGIVREEIGIDYSAPVANIIVAGGYIDITAKDNISGVKSVLYSVDGNAWETYTGKITMKNLSIGTHTIYVVVEDYAGNKEYANKTIVINAAPRQETCGVGTNFVYLLILIGIIVAMGVAMLLMYMRYREAVNNLGEEVNPEKENAEEPKKEISNEQEENKTE